jgi:HSP20 family protein
MGHPAHGAPRNRESPMTIVRYQPMSSALQMQNELKQVFDKLLGPAEGDQSSVVTSQWAPHVDIKEEPNRFVIYADIPGVEPKDIEVHMEKGVLSIKGERKVENVEQTDQYTRVERARGTFFRRFALPDSADPDGITAEGRHGVLEISIPKKPETTARRIEIKG